MMMLSVVPAQKSNLLLFRQDDPAYLLVSRRLRSSCTREQWDSPSAFAEVLRHDWSRAIADLAREGYEFVTPAPVTLYRRVDGTVAFADTRRRLTDPPRYVLPGGQKLAAKRVPKGQFAIHRTTYMHWAEGPLFHVELGMQKAPTPLDDPIIQYYRHQNAALRELIDSNMTRAEFAPYANVAQHDSPDIVDYKIAGIFKRPEFTTITSLQTGCVRPDWLSESDLEELL